MLENIELDIQTAADALQGGEYDCEGDQRHKVSIDLFPKFL